MTNSSLFLWTIGSKPFSWLVADVIHPFFCHAKMMASKKYEYAPSVCLESGTYSASSTRYCCSRAAITYGGELRICCLLVRPRSQYVPPKVSASASMDADVIGGGSGGEKEDSPSRSATPDKQAKVGIPTTTRSSSTYPTGTLNTSVLIIPGGSSPTNMLYQ